VTALDRLTSMIDATWFGAGLSAASRLRLAEFAREYEAEPGTVLLREGEETPELSLLVRGCVTLTAAVGGYGDLAFMTIEAGDIFGWSALLPPCRAAASVTALDPVHVLAFDGPRLRSAVRADPALAASIYQQVFEAVARRLLATRQRLFAVTGSPASGAGPRPRT
jgi:CRP/FNR family cyclic AMP-dependent transcriptional regulator